MCFIVFILIAMHPSGLGVKKKISMGGRGKVITDSIKLTKYLSLFWDLILLPNLVDFAKKQNQERIMIIID